MAQIIITIPQGKVQLILQCLAEAAGVDEDAPNQEKAAAARRWVLNVIRTAIAKQLRNQAKRAANAGIADATQGITVDTVT